MALDTLKIIAERQATLQRQIEEGANTVRDLRFRCEMMEDRFSYAASAGREQNSARLSATASR